MFFGYCLQLKVDMLIHSLTVSASLQNQSIGQSPAPLFSHLLTRPQDTVSPIKAFLVYRFSSKEP